MKRNTLHACSACGHSSARWFGRCPDCGSWNSAEVSANGESAALLIETLDRPMSAHRRVPTGIDEVDRVFGGGLVPGSAILLAGEPGIGKSTLILQLLGRLHAAGKKCLLISGEESLDQIGLRARRLGLDSSRFRAAASTSLQAVVAGWRNECPEVVVVDSIQAIAHESAEQPAGSPTQVRESATALIRCAKTSGAAVVLVGHVTKDGTVAGPKTLEHMVDVVIVLEGERSGSLRLLRAAKNRYGSCEETGVFTMTSNGLAAVADPSALLLADRRPGVPGSVVYPSLEGTRPVLIEVQALVTDSETSQPRRVAIGFEPRRLSAVLGVLAERGNVKVDRKDVFVAAAGGLAVREPAGDLALILAIASARTDVSIHSGTVAIGEVGLGGEVRTVPGLERRLAEARRLGFRRALVPMGVDGAARGMDVVPVAGVEDALRLVRCTRRAEEVGAA